VIAPGSWLGVMGGGQLGRMFATAAQRLGYRVLVLDPDPLCPAGAVADRHLCAPLDDAAALAEMSRLCPAITVETENVPVRALRRLEQQVTVRPCSRSVAIAQDRIQEKRFLTSLGIEVAPYAVIESCDDLRRDGITETLPGILKTSRQGYDGKGQRDIASLEELRSVFTQWQHAPCVLERRISLRTELSVLLARDAAGDTALWPVAENQHSGGILHTSIVPARVSPALAAAARDSALRIAQALGYCGVLCVEYFVTEGGRLLVNEIAPRPHNSGHHSIDACHVSQFEQQVRVLAGLPLGDTGLRSPAVTRNLMGELWRHGEPPWEAVLSAPRTQLHLYGKSESRTGRKMGHYTCLAEDTAQALAASERIRNALADPAAASLPPRHNAATHAALLGS
jgi:5-(carboxyamino)imidazole ribonucleotide synthase